MARTGSADARRKTRSPGSLPMENCRGSAPWMCCHKKAVSDGLYVWFLTSVSLFSIRATARAKVFCFWFGLLIFYCFRFLWAFDRSLINWSCRNSGSCHKAHVNLLLFIIYHIFSNCDQWCSNNYWHTWKHKRRCRAACLFIFLLVYIRCFFL